MLRKFLQPVYLFEKKEPDRNAADYYPGQKSKEVYSHQIQCNVQPARNEITSEIYGERVINILSLMCDNDAKIDKNMAVSLSGMQKAEYKIVSIEEYSKHKVIVIEAIL